MLKPPFLTPPFFFFHPPSSHSTPSAPDFVARMEVVRQAFSNARRNSWSVFEVQPELLQQIQALVASSRRGSLHDVAEGDEDMLGSDAVKARSAHGSRAGSARRGSAGNAELDQLEEVVDALEELAVSHGSDAPAPLGYQRNSQVRLPAAEVDASDADGDATPPRNAAQAVAKTAEGGAETKVSKGDEGCAVTRRDAPCSTVHSPHGRDLLSLAGRRLRGSRIPAAHAHARPGDDRHSPRLRVRVTTKRRWPRCERSPSTEHALSFFSSLSLFLPFLSLSLSSPPPLFCQP